MNDEATADAVDVETSAAEGAPTAPDGARDTAPEPTSEGEAKATEAEPKAEGEKPKSDAWTKLRIAD